MRLVKVKPLPHDGKHHTRYSYTLQCESECIRFAVVTPTFINKVVAYRLGRPLVVFVE